MAKTKTKKQSSGAGVIEGVILHKCGWVSDGGAFVEGAGCPKCGERIVAADVKPGFFVSSCELTDAELVDEDEDDDDDDDGE